MNRASGAYGKIRMSYIYEIRVLEGVEGESSVEKSTECATA